MLLLAPGNLKRMAARVADKWTIRYLDRLDLTRVDNVDILPPQVRSIKVHSCRDLLIGLDLTGLNPTRVPITFVHSANVTVDYIRWGTIKPSSTKVRDDFTITQKAPTRVESTAHTSTFTFMTLLRHYAKQVLTTQ